MSPDPRATTEPLPSRHNAGPPAANAEGIAFANRALRFGNEPNPSFTMALGALATPIAGGALLCFPCHCTPLTRITTGPVLAALGPKYACRQSTMLHPFGMGLSSRRLAIAPASADFSTMPPPGRLTVVSVNERHRGNRVVDRRCRTHRTGASPGADAATPRTSMAAADPRNGPSARPRSGVIAADFATRLIVNRGVATMR